MQNQYIWHKNSASNSIFLKLLGNMLYSPNTTKKEKKKDFHNIYPYYLNYIGIQT